MRRVCEIFLLSLLVTACGVKGPPLPPLPATPQRADAPHASPRPQPSSSGDPAHE